MNSFTQMSWMGRSPDDKSGLALFEWTDADGVRQRHLIPMECCADAMKVCDFADARARNAVAHTRKQLLRLAEELK